MKRRFFRIITAVLCAAMVCTLPAFAAEMQPAQPETGSPQPYPMAPVRVWGRVTKLDSGGLLVQNSNENDPYHEIILHGESIRILDAVTGLPLDRDLRDGEVIYAWVGPAMTMSLPPHATAQIIVANIPPDAGAPQYYPVAKVRAQDDGPECVDLVTTDGTELTVTKDAVLFPYLTRQMVYLSSIVPGNCILVWTGAAGVVTRVMLFAYDYRGYAAWEPTGEVSVNGQVLPVTGKVTEEDILLPIRAVAEAAGYRVDWTAEDGAMVFHGDGTPVFSILPGQATAHTPTGERELTGQCLNERGTTYLPAADLTELLELFAVYEG